MALPSLSGYAFSMQRKWRIGRLVLAGLFLALAVGAYAYWPATMRWRVDRLDRNVIGFCPAKDVVWTVNGYLDPTSPDASDHLSGLDIASGSRVLGHQLPYGSFLASDNTLSSDGRFLAVSRTALKRLTILDTTSGEQLIQMETAPNYFYAIFSDDGHWFVIANTTSIEIWDLRRQCRHLTYDLKQLEQRVHAKTLQTNINLLLERNRTSLSISKDARYLSFWREDVLSVFEMDTMKLVGQAECLGCPQFMADGTIAAYQAESYVLKPWNSTFVIDNQELKCVGQNSTMDIVKVGEHSEYLVAQNQTRYVTIQSPSTRLCSPDWIPTSVQPFVNQLLAKLNKHWLITLRDLNTGKEMCHFGVPHVDDTSVIGTTSLTAPLGRSVVSGSFAPGYALREYAPFAVFISPDHCWLVKQDRNSIELWPLVTWWRPWYCWATVAGLTAMAAYFLWYSRRVCLAQDTSHD